MTPQPIRDDDGTAKSRDLARWTVGVNRHWILALRLNQRTLGSCYLILKRSVKTPGQSKLSFPSLSQLNSREFSSMGQVIRGYEQTLRSTFGAVHFNYLFSGQSDRNQIHLHMFPRYAQPVHYLNRLWSDDRWPDFLSFPKVDDMDGEYENMSQLRVKLQMEMVTMRKLLKSGGGAR